jgi:hypothetical protein
MKRGILIVILGILCWVPVATAQEKPRDAEKLGNVHFPVSCLPATQPQFDRAVAMLHSSGIPRALRPSQRLQRPTPAAPWFIGELR